MVVGSAVVKIFRLWFWGLILCVFCQAVVFGLVLSLFCQAMLFFGLAFFVWLWSLFWSCFRLIFGYGYAVAEALRLWSLVLFLLSLLSGVVALLRTRLLFVYFFFISSFVCFFYLFLRCFSGLCLLSLSGGSCRTTCFFFVRSRFVIISGCAFGFVSFVFSCCV